MENLESSNQRCGSRRRPYLFKTFRVPEELWARLEALVPPRKRSAVIRDGIKQQVVRLERQAKKEREG